MLEGRSGRVIFSQFQKHLRKNSDPRRRKEMVPFCLGTRLMATRPVVVWLWFIPAHIVWINFIVYGAKHQAGLETQGTSKRVFDQRKLPRTRLAMHWGWQDKILKVVQNPHLSQSFWKRDRFRSLSLTIWNNDAFPPQYRNLLEEQGRQQSSVQLRGIFPLHYESRLTGERPTPPVSCS